MGGKGIYWSIRPPSYIIPTIEYCVRSLHTECGAILYHSTVSLCTQISQDTTMYVGRSAGCGVYSILGIVSIRSKGVLLLISDMSSKLECVV